MVLSQSEKIPKNRDTLEMPRSRKAIEKERGISRYLRQIQIAGYVVNIQRRVFEVNMIAGNEIHLVPLDKDGSSPDPKGDTQMLLKMNPEEMIGNYLPSNNKGTIIIDPRKRAGRDTLEGEKKVMPIGEELRREAEENLRKQGKINRFGSSANENPLSYVKKGFRPPSTGPSDAPFTRTIDGKPEYQVETPYAKTKKQRARALKKRKEKTA